MGRYGNYPTTVEDSLIFRLKTLLNGNNSFLTSYGIHKGVTSWSRNEEVFAKINIEVYHTENQCYITFDYRCNGEPKKYKVELISRTSNLGKGKIWYFVCPNTEKKCRKLYLQSGYFLHRTATKLMYQKQIESKKNRALIKIFDAVHIPDDVFTELNKKYFKTHYKGKPTKRYLKLKSKIDIAESYPPDTMERLLMM